MHDIETIRQLHGKQGARKHGHGVFHELRDIHYFNQVDILFGAVTWPNEQDITPETLLAEMTLLKMPDSSPASQHFQ
ncbi:MAG TPA: hypothetical protein VJ001_04860 [Rhodocyclaceae bacterium]|nr:hypothetical protein [Rhodocyclaceae bacterium]